MISFNNLGRMGRLGNQMFQYAALKGIARKRGLEFCIPFSPDINEWIDHQLSRVFTLDSNLIYNSPANKPIEQRGFEFDPMIYNFCDDNSDLIGYFQSEKFFIEIKTDILNDFTFKKTFELPCEQYTSIHVRRGDYVDQASHHPTLPVEYYMRALEVVGKDHPVVILSDDINWCRNNIPADFYMDGNSNIHDLYIMTKAQHNIIANSSFSWWGAWLNQNTSKKVVSPNPFKNWFGPALSHYDMSDLIPQDWIKI